MTISLSAAIAKAVLLPLATSLNGGTMRIFSGSRPDSADDAETGTLLGIVTVDGAGGGLHYQLAGMNLFNAPNEQWVFTALAAGVATWFRLVAPGDTGAATNTQLRIDGDIGTFTDPGDMSWVDPTVVLGEVYTIDSFVYVLQPIGN